MVLKYGSLITSGHTAGHGLPHIRLNTQREVHHYKLHRKNNTYNCYTKHQLIFKYTKAEVLIQVALNIVVIQLNYLF